MALSQPRIDSESSASSDEEGEADVNGELDQLSPAARMYHKSMVFQQDQKRIREEATNKQKRKFKIPVRPSCHTPATPKAFPAHIGLAYAFAANAPTAAQHQAFH